MKWRPPGRLVFMVFAKLGCFACNAKSRSRDGAASALNLLDSDEDTGNQESDPDYSIPHTNAYHITNRPY